MNIVFLTHPSFLGSLSMPRYAGYLMNGMRARGHTVDLWSPEAHAYNWPAPASAKKWLGYTDQYLLFPQTVKQRMKQLPKDTLFVLTDHALGPYVPLVADRPHVVHCHDFLAQRSALGELSENPTSWTGQRYQQFIRNGYTKGRHFISISSATQQDLHRFLGKTPSTSEIVYNGLLTTYTPNLDPIQPKHELQRELSIDLSAGFLLHVGGNQWYKNRLGVIKLYEAWRAGASTSCPLLLAGPAPTQSLQAYCTQSSVSRDIHFVTNASDSLIKRLYQNATLLLFPSLAEGFGWPIIEAMASGCLVLTTDAAPMTEVAGEAAFLIPRQTPDQPIDDWAISAAEQIDHIFGLTTSGRSAAVAAGLLNVLRFNPDTQLDQIERFYERVISAMV